MTDDLGMASEDDDFYVTEWEKNYAALNSVHPDALTSTIVLEFVPCARPKQRFNWKLWGALSVLLLAILLLPRSESHLSKLKWPLTPSKPSQSPPHTPHTHSPVEDPRLPERISNDPAPVVPTLEEYVDQVIDVIDSLESAQDKLENMASQLRPRSSELYNFADPSVGGSIMWFLTDWNMYERLLWHRARDQLRAYHWNDPKNTLLANDKHWQCDSEYCALAILTLPMEPKRIIIELDPQASPLTDIAICALPQNYRERSYSQNKELQCSLPLLAPKSDTTTLVGWLKMLLRKLQPTSTKIELAVPQSFQRLGESYDGFYLELKSRTRILVLRVSLMGTLPDEMALTD